MERTDISQKFPLESSIPNFELPNVDGRSLGSKYFEGSRCSLIVFTCNHCPYVKGSEMMLIELAKNFEKDGLRVLAISSNDAAQYPEDSFENMKLKSKELKLPYPYLYDESQEVARKFDAACTPECYLFDANAKLVYHGAITDRPKDASATRNDLLSVAVKQLLEGQKPNPAFSNPIGCSIKWKRI